MNDQLNPMQQQALADVRQAQQDYLDGIERLKEKRRAAFIRAAHQKVKRRLIADAIGISVRTVSLIMNGK